MLFDLEKKTKAIETLLKLDLQYTKTISMLGYPSYQALRKWYREYLKNGKTIPSARHRKHKYTEEQEMKAVQYYIEHGKNASKTIRALGYPCRVTLYEWLSAHSIERKYCVSNSNRIEYSSETKREAVIALSTRNVSAQKIAESYSVSREALYGWKYKYLGRLSGKMKNIKNESANKENTSNCIQELKQEIEQLTRDRDRLQLEVDLLTNAETILKKDKGINLQELKNNEKAELIDTLRNKYRLKTLLFALKMTKSSYFYQEKSRNKADKYVNARGLIKTIFLDSNKTYGYRRVHCSLKRMGVTLSEKVVLRLMHEDGLTVITIKLKKYSSYAGEITPAVENLIKRNFHADCPNKVWLTDITEFHIPAGKIYLSPMVDCFDGLPVAWAMSTTPDSDLVNTMLREAIATLKTDEHPIVHTDRGCHYRWPEWIRLMDESKLVRSMSKKGCSPDNAACEGFHGRIKNEFFYNKDWRGVSIEEFMRELDKYLKWYSCERIKLSLDGLSPIEYRKKLGYIAS